MENRIHVDRLREQSCVLSELMENIPSQLDERPETLVIDGNTFTNLNLCDVWRFIRFILIGERNNQMDGILGNIRFILRDILDDDDIRNCALKAEIQRFLRLIDCLIRSLRKINCNDDFERLVGKLFCLLVRLVLILLSLISKLIILLSVCRDCDRRYNNTRLGFCRCLIDEFAKELDDLCILIDEFECLNIEFRRGDRPFMLNRPWDFDRNFMYNRNFMCNRNLGYNRNCRCNRF